MQKSTQHQTHADQKYRGYSLCTEQLDRLKVFQINQTPNFLIAFQTAHLQGTLYKYTTLVPYM